MRTSSRTNIMSQVGRSQRYYPTVTERDIASPTVSNENGNYDSVTLSTSPDDTSRFYKDLVGRLSQEVRTTTTTGDIKALRHIEYDVTYSFFSADVTSVLFGIKVFGVLDGFIGFCFFCQKNRNFT
mgnify:CR=1 FL=1